MLQGHARHDLVRCAGRDLAAALRALGHAVLRADLTALSRDALRDLAAQWSPDAAVAFDAEALGCVEVPARALVLAEHPLAGPPLEVPRGLRGVVLASEHADAPLAGALRAAPPWGAPSALADEFPAHAPRPIPALLAATWRPPERLLAALRASLPRHLGARAMDFCDHWLAAVQGDGVLAPEPMDASLARFLDLAALPAPQAEMVLRAVYPGLARWYRARVIGRALESLAAGGTPFTLVGDGPWPDAVLRARRVTRLPAMGFDDYRSLCGAARAVLDLAPVGGALPAAAAALMAGARLVAAPIPALVARAPGGDADVPAAWLAWRDLDDLDAVLARAVGDDDARARGQSFARARLTWEPLARDLAQALAEGAPRRVSIAA